MKSLISILALLLTLCASAIAQDTNALASKASSGITAILETYSTVTDVDSYNAANRKYEQQIKQLLPLIQLLKASPTPTDQQTQQFVVSMVNQETRLAAIMTKLSKNQQAANPKVRGLLRIALHNFNKDIEPLVAELDRLYPSGKINPLVEAERKRREGQ